jgi:hypothetical protein
MRRDRDRDRGRVRERMVGNGSKRKVKGGKVETKEDE